MKAVGVFGGSFDPIHLGHLLTTRLVYEKRNLDKVIFIPNNISPLKTDLTPTSSLHRMNMLKLAVESFPYFEVSDYEINKSGVSYTYDTLLELKKSYPKLELIIGYDNLLVFDKWHLPEKILELVTLVVMKRSTDIEAETKNKFFDSAIIIDTPTIEISATEIRKRVKEGLSIEYLVPKSVKEYISQNGLYK